MSYSVPTSPAVSRSNKVQPVTPQRPPPRHQPRSQSFYRSPLTPSTSPYTPISLRSFESASSTLTTPDTTGLSIQKRLAFAGISPDVTRSSSCAKDPSLADIAENWRSRASENGIKVSFAEQDDSNYLLDESSDMSSPDTGNDSNILSGDEGGLGAPFLSAHRRMSSLPAATTRPRAQSHSTLASRAQPQSPMTIRSSRTSGTRSSQNQNTPMNLMSTPPPNRALSKQLKLKGCQTDPPQPRRREALGSVPVLPNLKNASMSMTLEPDTSLNLFDIHENDLESEGDYDLSQVENSFASHTGETPLFGYPAFGSHAIQNQPLHYAQPLLADPFHPITNINDMHTPYNFSESINHHFHASRQHLQNPHFEDITQPGLQFLPNTGNPHLPLNHGMPQHYQPPTFAPHFHPQFVPVSASHLPRPTYERTFSNASAKLAPKSSTPSRPKDCSVCLASSPSKLAILQPCGHPLCSVCLTSALNIVGEKDMECAVCKQSVADFKLMMISKSDSNPRTPETKPLSLSSDALMQPLYANSPHSSKLSLDSQGDFEGVFDFGLDFGDLRASTPKIEQQHDRAMTSDNQSQDIDNIVLRIDNVPWDITPTQISRWLQQPIERVHVLLDRKGKTMSHAYVEVRNAATAGSILRGEVASISEKKERGSVLGKGRRARGVTITRSGQQELMADLFPSWRGNFDGSKPSLSGIQSERLIGALESGLLTEYEVAGLIHLIREPDSHFLKVPSLPFHSLISWLSKLPKGADSQVYLSVNIRDRLFDATYTAVETLLDRVTAVKQTSTKTPHSEEYTNDLVIDLFHSGLLFRAFTTQQHQALVELGNKKQLPLPVAPTLSTSESSDRVPWTRSSAPITPISFDENPCTLHNSTCFHGPERSVHEIAREFGVDAQVVQALAQRLAQLN